MKKAILLLGIMGLLSQTKAQTVSDFDGNVYKTVSIGAQVWLDQNLKSTRLNDGTIIETAKDNSLWGKLKTPGYCWYNDSIQHKETYGALYNWYTISTAKICPAGWRVPTENDWLVLIGWLGGEDLAGGKMKESGTSHWRFPNNDAADKNNFTALPGGYRSTDGSFIPVGAFDAIGIGGGWWSSDEKDTENAWGRTIYFNTGRIARAGNLKTVGFSVRCLQDNK